jgi:hypothetical protein
MFAVPFFFCWITNLCSSSLILGLQDFLVSILKPGNGNIQEKYFITLNKGGPRYSWLSNFVSADNFLRYSWIFIVFGTKRA